MRASLHFRASEVDWPNHADGDYARRFLTPWIDEGVDAYIANVRTRVGVARVGDVVLPLTVNDKEYSNSYVASPYTHYITYAKEELVRISSPATRALLGALIATMDGWLRLAETNRVVHVNNWLVSTNLYPALGPAHIAALTHAIIDRFPNHGIVFRSVCSFARPGFVNTFRAEGYAPILSRQVYWLDTSVPRNLRSKPFKGDCKLLRETDYQQLAHGDLRLEDMPRVKALYDQLYLDKYSKLNPAYSVRFFEHAWRERLLEMRALRGPDGRIDGVLGFFLRGGVITTPLLGYEMSVPQRVGLYRMLGAMLSLEARDKGWLLNDSSGAAHFKRLRREVPAAEYSCVYTKHLPPARRAHWRVLAELSERFGDVLRKRFAF